MIQQIDFSLDPDGDGDGLVQAAIDKREPFAVGGYEYVPGKDRRGEPAWRVIRMDTQCPVLFWTDWFSYWLTDDQVFNYVQHGLKP